MDGQRVLTAVGKIVLIEAGLVVVYHFAGEEAINAIWSACCIALVIWLIRGRK